MHNPQLKSLFSEHRWTALWRAPGSLLYTAELEDGNNCDVTEEDALAGHGTIVTRSRTLQEIGRTPFESLDGLFAHVKPLLATKTSSEKFMSWMDEQSAKLVPRLAKSYGFEFIHTGGGCTGLAKNLGGEDYERYVLITSALEESDCLCPEEAREPALVGIVSPDAGENDAEPRRFDDVVAALEYGATLK